MEIRRQLNTYRYKKSTVNRLLTYMGGDFGLEDLTPAVIDAYLLEQVNSRGTKSANRDLLELKAILNWSIRKDLFQSNPFRRIDPYPEEKFARYVPPAVELAKVRQVAIG